MADLMRATLHASDVFTTQELQHEDSSIVRVTTAHYFAGTFVRQPSKLLALNFLAPVCRQKTSTLAENSG